jgi:hypothetical protein
MFIPCGRSRGSHRWLLLETTGHRARPDALYSGVEHHEGVSDGGDDRQGNGLPPARLAPQQTVRQQSIEADHGRLISRLWPMRGLTTGRGATVVIIGHAFVQNIPPRALRAWHRAASDSADRGSLQRAGPGDLTEPASTVRLPRLRIMQQPPPTSLSFATQFRLREHGESARKTSVTGRTRRQATSSSHFH